MVVNGRPTKLRMRDRPRELLIRFIDGEIYRSEIISLDAMFKKTISAPKPLYVNSGEIVTVPALTSVKRTVAREAIPKKQIVRLKTRPEVDKGLSQ